ncbi:TetR/AcrR family transcriptional regulator [Planotetraspora kaengkrachanensis]|uniref:TetR family transcriptional regulator n=1 Tax=Planotetraspora kaengkrachanensis TaxID=575193 RepID=A0A8J3Q028_9ACTN|nr:TetR/AcrR family transcriptional regulator [Planotetraspora kaengkrachanensis]GIG84110.1 TetR family transcriptional regulator [Planotetraspora kaengkrachanensis]
MSEAAVAKRDSIVSAALAVFGRYGYRRTSMELIAQAAGMSRPALYQVFTGKEDVFRAVAQKIVDDVTSAAQQARERPGSVAERLYNVLSIKLELFAGTIEAEFRAEMFAEAKVIAEDVLTSFEKRYLEVVEAVLHASRDELDLLDVAIPTRDAAALLIDTLAGIFQEKRDLSVLSTRLRQMIDLTVRGLTTRPRANG